MLWGVNGDKNIVPLAVECWVKAKNSQSTSSLSNLAAEWEDEADRCNSCAAFMLPLKQFHKTI